MGGNQAGVHHPLAAGMLTGFVCLAVTNFSKRPAELAQQLPVMRL
jgi:hypothetical protein